MKVSRNTSLGMFSTTGGGQMEPLIAGTRRSVVWWTGTRLICEMWRMGIDVQNGTLLLLLLLLLQNVDDCVVYIQHSWFCRMVTDAIFVESRSRIFVRSLGRRFKYTTLYTSVRIRHNKNEILKKLTEFMRFVSCRPVAYRAVSVLHCLISCIATTQLSFSDIVVYNTGRKHYNDENQVVF